MSKTDWQWTMFDPEAKQKRHDEEFPQYCLKARELGKQMAERSGESNGKSSGDSNEESNGDSNEESNGEKSGEQKS